MHSPSGYVADVPYVHFHTREVAPAWLDLVVTLSGFESPPRGVGRRFAWCELGCGYGVTAAILAGTHPGGDFHAIDAMPEHIAYARRLCDDAGIANLTLHDVDFAAAAEREFPRFDYIVAHGVYSWIDARARADMRRFIDRHLAPGGVVYVGYNAMPGWAADAPFQYLVRALAAAARAGDSVGKFVGAMETVQALIAAGAPPLVASVMATAGWEQLRKTHPLAYFAHEYLPLAWQPMYVTQMRADMAEIGLTPAGSATVRENFDAFVLRPAAREALAEIADPDLRELVRDYFLDQRFRRDVFVREARQVGDGERERRLTEGVFDLSRPVELARYAMDTQAGHIDFDGPVPRAIVSALADGPRRLADLSSDPSMLLAAAMGLCSAGDITPAEPAVADVGRLNEVLARRRGVADALPYIVLPTGVAGALPPEVLRAVREGEAAVPDDMQPWLEFLRRRLGG